jgi:hypothetical protein
MHLGYACRGQGVRCADRFGTIRSFAAEVDGEQFVVVRFRDGEELLSVHDLEPATVTRRRAARRTRIQATT